MLEVSSLSNPIVFQKPISIVVADIDYTLMDFAKAQDAAIKSLIPTFGNDFSSIVSNIFMLINEEHQHKDTNAWDKKENFEKVMMEITEIERPSITQFGLKRWSRESWMIIASRKLKMGLKKTEIELGRDTYWSAHAKNSFLYEDAKKFLDELKKRNIALILMTSGDSIMHVNENLTLSYDPIFSEAYKMKRVSILPLEYKSIILGETIDKPDPKFFELVYSALNKLGNFDKKSVLFVGDSPKSDLMVPEKDGYSALLIKR